MSLPVEAALPELRRGLTHHNTLILQAPPGAGKTTRIPLALLDEPWLAGQTILMLEPRRLAARAAAARMSDTLGQPPGQSVGYQIRFERRIGSNTRIQVLTEGILTRRLQSDPGLEGVGLVIFDEFHERSLQADLGLALCREAQQALRDDLRILIMSATLDGAALAALLDEAPVVTSQGRRFPVDVHYLPKDPAGPVPATVAGAVIRALGEQPGDILAFLPGAGEIRRTGELLADDPACRGVVIAPLYGDLPQSQQQSAILPDPQGRRRVVLATPIAETSLTIEGVTTVVDAGLTRTPRFEPRSGLSRLVTVRIGQDSAEQRAGRAGRLGPGTCYRLWSEATQRSLPPRLPPEIREADLAPLALELALWGVEDAGTLSWLDPPPPGALAQARELLQSLEALDDQGRITATGRQMAALGTHPRLAHLLLRGRQLGLGALAADLAALLEERDLFRGDQGRDRDLTRRLSALTAFRRQGRQGAARLGADPGACARVQQAADRWRPREGDREAGRNPDDAAGLLVALAYPDRIAQNREGEPGRYRLASGRGVRLDESDALAGQNWLAVAQLDAGRPGEEGRIYLAAPLDPADLETHLAGLIREEQQVAWEPRQQAVVARRLRRLGANILAQKPLSNPDPRQLAAAMAEGIRRLGLEALPWSPELRQWQARLLCLRHWRPGEDWPDVHDATLLAELEDWLGPFLGGITRRDHLARLDLTNALKARLDWPRQQRLEALAPTHLTVPSGSRLRLEYRPGEAPVLAVKLQEMFGLGDTPRVADGRVAVVLHLLSPARRPIQVTQDLKGFWERTYPEVRKELKGRYPKHPWPDDPWNAPPTARVRPRS